LFNGFHNMEVFAPQEHHTPTLERMLSRSHARSQHKVPANEHVPKVTSVVLALPPKQQVENFAAWAAPGNRKGRPRGRP
jgi:hypothetical protein